MKNIWSWTQAYLDTVCRAPSRCCGKPCSGPGPSPSCAGCCPPGWCSPQCAAERPYSRKSCIIFSSLSNIFQPGGHPHHGVCAVLPLRPGELPHVQAAAVAQPAIEIKISHQIFFLCSKYFLPLYLPLMLSVLWATGWRWKLSGSLSFTKMLRLRSSGFQACRTW